MVVSSKGGTPKRLVYDGKILSKLDDNYRGTPTLGKSIKMEVLYGFHWFSMVFMGKPSNEMSDVSFYQRVLYLLDPAFFEVYTSLSLALIVQVRSSQPTNLTTL